MTLTGANCIAGQRGRFHSTPQVFDLLEIPNPKQGARRRQPKGRSHLCAKLEWAQQCSERSTVYLAECRS